MLFLLLYMLFYKVGMYVVLQMCVCVLLLKYLCCSVLIVFKGIDKEQIHLTMINKMFHVLLETPYAYV